MILGLDWIRDAAVSFNRVVYTTCELGFVSSQLTDWTVEMVLIGGGTASGEF